MGEGSVQLCAVAAGIKNNLNFTCLLLLFLNLHYTCVPGYGNTPSQTKVYKIIHGETRLVGNTFDPN